MSRAPAEPQLRTATRATYAVFAVSGFTLASWASRIPQVKAHLHLDPSRLGLLLITLAIGSVISLPLSGPVVSRVGSRRAVATMGALAAAGLVVASAGYQIGEPVLGAGLFLLGFSAGLWDVAMNVQAAAVEQRLGRSIMSRFHAGFSLGTVAGALIGTLMVAAQVPVSIHLAVAGVIIAAVVPAATRWFLPDQADRPDPAPAGQPDRAGQERRTDRPMGAAPGPPPARHSLAAWWEPRTLLVGILVLAFAFAEGAGNDWISVSVIDHHHVVPAVGTLAFAAFLAAMTVGRWFGPALLDRWGRVVVLRATAALAVAGLILFVLGPGIATALAGALVWGLGASLGFPVGMSAGADEPAFAAGRVSVIASIGYCAFLGGPPLIGFLGDHVTVTRALLSVAAALIVATAITGAAAPPPAEQAAAGERESAVGSGPVGSGPVG